MYLKIGGWAIYRFMTQGCAIHKMTSEHAHLKKKHVTTSCAIPNTLFL